MKVEVEIPEEEYCGHCMFASGGWGNECHLALCNYLQRAWVVDVVKYKKNPSCPNS